MKVTTVQLGKLATIIGGYAFKSRDFVEQGVPVVKIANVTWNGVDLSDSLFLPDEYLSLKDKFHVNCGDVLVSLTGSQLSQPNSVVGRVARYTYDNTALLNQRVGKLIPHDVRKCDIHFVYYFLKQSTVTYQLAVNAKGSANQANISGKDIERLKVPDFSIEQQHNCVSILSAYDDLIENNRRRIQLLEQAARLLYKEWFVRLRFPGHEHVKIIDGVPEGWSRVDLNSIIRIEHGYAFKGAYFSEQITPRILLTPGNFKMGGGIKLDKLKYYSTLGPLSQKYILKKDDLLITMTDLSKSSDTLGYALLVPKLNGKVFLHNQRLGAVYPTEGVPFYRHFLNQLFKDRRYRSSIVGSASGTSVKHTSPKKILSYKPALPHYETSILIKEFDDKVRSMNRQIHNLLQTNEKLVQTRDLLLPRLMNGEVTV